MKKLPALLSTLFLFLSLSLSLAAGAAAADPSGHWQWEVKGPQGSTDVSAVFALKDGALTGTVTAMGNDVAIANATFKDGVVAFIIIRHMGDDTFEIKYSGKLDGDTITGTVDRPIGDGERKTFEWKATRAH